MSITHNAAERNEFLDTQLNRVKYEIASFKLVITYEQANTF